MQSTGRVQQAYLFEISQELFQVLLSHSDVKLTALGDLKPYLAIKDSQKVTEVRRIYWASKDVG
jgi:hypothetical protein